MDDFFQISGSQPGEAVAFMLTLGSVWRHFWLSQLEKVLLASHGLRRQGCCSTPECTGRSVTKNYPAQYGKSATAEKTYSTPCIFERGENWFLMARKI